MRHRNDEEPLLGEAAALPASAPLPSPFGNRWRLFPRLPGDKSENGAFLKALSTEKGV